MKKSVFILYFIFASTLLFPQAEDEIQVYASPTIGKGATIFELHSNYNLDGLRYQTPAEKEAGRFLNGTIEINHGFGKNFEIGLYIFTAIVPGQGYQYLGNRIRPRVTVPEEWRWPVGASLSLEVGFHRYTQSSSFTWGGELRPILDKTWGDFYLSFNPNLDLDIESVDNALHVGVSPQLKAVYTVSNIGFGFEYYTGLGTFEKIEGLDNQNHLIGPVIDVYAFEGWELNMGYLFGLTDYSNTGVAKLIFGRTIGK